MKRILCSIIFLLATIASAAPVAFFLGGPGASDTNTGADIAHPVLTLNKARALIAASSPTANACTVWVRGGTYRFASQVSFSATDSGSSAAPVIYRAYNQETPVFTGAINVPATSFAAITSVDAKWPRFPASSRASIVAVNLTPLGVTSTGFSRHGFSINLNGTTSATPYYLGARMENCRWPKRDAASDTLTASNSARRGYVGFSSVVSAGSAAGSTVSTSSPPTVGVASSLASVLAGWNVSAGDIEVNGIFANSWQWSVGLASSFSGSNLGLTYAEYDPIPSAANQPFGNNFFFQNAPEFLTEPGEYYIDKSANRLYLIPPYGWVNSSSLEVSSTTTLINATGCSYIQFDGITFGETTNHSISIGNGVSPSNNWTFNRCVFRNSGLRLLNTYGARNLLVDGSLFTGAGTEAIYVDASGSLSSSAIVPGNCVIRNSSVHDSSLMFPTQSIHVGGVGHSVVNNDIYNLPHSAIHYSGTNIIISGNRIHDVQKETCDMGGIYTSDNNIFSAGNVISDNFIFNVGNKEVGLPGIAAIYVDRMAGSVRIVRNLFANCSQYRDSNYAPIYVNGGPFVAIDDTNSFFECPLSVTYSAFGPSNYGNGLMSSLAAGSGNGAWHVQLDSAIAGYPSTTDARLEAFPYLKTFFQSGNHRLVAGSSPAYYFELTSSFDRNIVANHRNPPRDPYPGTVLSSSNTLDACITGGSPSLKVGTLNVRK